MLTTKFIFDVANMLKKITVKDVLMNDYTSLFIPYVLKQGLYPISSGKLQILSSSPIIH